jgi:uncharacterized protein (TIGR00369 family)
MNDVATAKLTVKELEGLLGADSPKLFNPQTGLTIEEVWQGGCSVRKRFDPRTLRSGGTVSGPTMMALADFAMYVAVLASVGWVPHAATTNLSINFLKRPAPRDLLAVARLIKLGKRLAVGEIGVRSEGEDELVAHATCTYAIPTQRLHNTSTVNP